jgi:hypothetical protein
VYQDSVCETCSDDQLTVRHTHMSSEGIRVFTMENMSKQFLFNCIMCKQSESIVRPSTRKIILTDSTLYNVWSYAKLKTADHHMEIEAVVGGRIRNLTRALMMLYLKQPQRLEVILIGGLNNLGEDQPVADILDEIHELKEAVLAHSTLHDHKPLSTVSVSTVMYVPKFCSLDVPANQPEWAPPTGLKNKRREIESLNAAIAAVNKGSGVNYLKLHLEGIRIDKKSGKTMHRHNPANPIWREPVIWRRLHLTPDYKIRIVNLSKKVFRGGLSKLGDWQPAQR